MSQLAHMVTAQQVEHLDEAGLQSKFTNLMAILIRTQAAVGERAIALAALETVETAINRKRLANSGPRF